MNGKEVMPVVGPKPPVELRYFAVVTAVLMLCFGEPLYALLRFAAMDDLYSYIPLIPLISFYLVWTRRKQLPPLSPPAHKLAALFFAGGLAVIAGGWLAGCSRPLANEDHLALAMVAFLCFFWSISCLFLGKATLRAIAFPMALLIFMIPLPGFLRHEIESFLQYGSAAVASGLFMLSGTPVYHDGLLFRLPGFNLEVAPECSGIRSTLVLFITSLMAGHLFLRQPWKRAVLALAVIPLALLRNGFRIFVIGQLCVRVGPEMINSPVHRHGGPLFFILSLIPLFLLLFYFRKSEQRIKPSPPQTSEISYAKT